MQFQNSLFLLDPHIWLVRAQGEQGKEQLTGCNTGLCEICETESTNLHTQDSYIGILSCKGT